MKKIIPLGENEYTDAHQDDVSNIEKQYWYTHPESNSVWMGPDGQEPGAGGMVIQFREAYTYECDDEVTQNRILHEYNNKPSYRKS